MIRKTGLVSVLVMLLAGSLVPAQAADDWTEIRAAIQDAKGDVGGWPNDAAAHVYKNPTGEVLKIATGALGTYRLDLKAGKLFRILDSGEKEIRLDKLFHRNGGSSIVVRSSEIKIKIDLREPLPAVNQYLSGLQREM